MNCLQSFRRRPENRRWANLTRGSRGVVEGGRSASLPFPVLRPVAAPVRRWRLLLAAPRAAFAKARSGRRMRTTWSFGPTRRVGGGHSWRLSSRATWTSRTTPRGARCCLNSCPPTSRGARVKRVVGVEPDATVRVTLSIPLAGVRRGTLRVYDRGRELDSHTRFVGGTGFWTRRRPLQCSSSRPDRSIVPLTSRRSPPLPRAYQFKILSTDRATVRLHVGNPRSRAGPVGPRVRARGSSPVRQLARLVDRLQRTRFRRHLSRRPVGNSSPP